MNAILEEVLAEQQQALRATMRAKFPFLKDDALDKALRGASDLIRNIVQKEAPAMTESHTRFNFFSLPAELRNNIYEELIESPGCIQSLEILHDHTGENEITCYGLDKCFRRPPPITKVCRQMRQETLSIYLGRSIEAFVDIDAGQDISSETPRKSDMNGWLEMIGPEFARLIKNLTSVTCSGGAICHRRPILLQDRL